MKLRVVRDDITKVYVDAIVLPANSKLKEGWGASAAIFNKAGRENLKQELKRYGKVEAGDSVVTRGFELPSKYIIHSVVPAWKDGAHDEYQLLCAAYISALEMADELECSTIAFPLLASGNNGFDTNLALDVAIKTIERYEPSGSLNWAFLVLYGTHATALAKERGYDVEKHIDQEYVLAHEEDQKPKTKLSDAFDRGKEIAKLFVEDAIAMAIDRLNNPEIRKQIIEKAAEIIKAIIEARDSKEEDAKEESETKK